ncbi:hypothetical protein AN944_01503 [Shewanella sp. P1-14-1]|nr:hypothetical protein AN944_01503 [Shewanella sp. P1-14-1]
MSKSIQGSDLTVPDKIGVYNAIKKAMYSSPL